MMKPLGVHYLLLFSYSVIYEVLDNKAHLSWNNMDYGENHGWEFGGNFDFIMHKCKEFKANID